MYIEGEGEVRGGGSRLERESASMATHTPSRGRVKKEKPVGLGRKGEATIEYFLRRDDN